MQWIRDVQAMSAQKRSQELGFEEEQVNEEEDSQVDDNSEAKVESIEPDEEEEGDDEDDILAQVLDDMEKIIKTKK